ncbi:ectonucleotide pyrophosphatase/phosphodiesterase family member 5-like [Ptychodera flava]|uniref:ectonucleotide pyrophosphatase/phosphodiesterase family member 5-like n=1 Tax=Ptychodera flava TaxID=63121 RepID=UPI00396A8F34
MMESLISFRSFLTLLFSVVGLSKGLHHGPLTLLISFDGFRWDYLQKVETPNFDVLISDGSFVPNGIVPTFITKTFPNHFTIATGLYEESHGIVATDMYDPVLNEKFHIGGEDSTSSKWWDVGAEPIWVTNQKHGGRTGVYYWPGSETEIMGIRPNRYKINNDTTPFERRIDDVIDWFTDEDPINLGLLYFNEPDHTGHTSGPESDEILDVIRLCDDTIGYLIQRLQEADLYQKINILITSDHGMTEISPDRLIQLDDYVNPDLYVLVDSSPVAAIYPVDNRNTMAIYNAFARKHPNMTVYLKDSIPDHFHYKHNRRIMPIIAVADEGWCIVGDKTTWLNDTEIEGGHGYDNRYKSMHPFFIAHGPAIKRDFTLEQFNNVDIYPLICKIMEIEAAPNNGSLAIAGTMLRSHDSHDHSLPSHHSVKPITSSKTLIIAISIPGGIALIAAILLTAMCVTQRSYRLKGHVKDIPDKENKQVFLLEVEDA